MRQRWFTATAFATILMLALTATAAAGGWATVEMDKPVTRIEVDQEMTLDFMLLQHGVTPADWPKTYFEATNTETGETMRVDATPGAEAGRWTVDVAFASAGTWNWAIKTEELMVEGDFPTLEVVGNAAVVSNTGGVTETQLTAAVTSATEPLEKQISSMVGEMDVLQKQVTNLAGERDTLQKQIMNLEAAQAEQVAQPESTGASWWVAALAGAFAALIVGGAGAILAVRHGLIRTPELRTASA
ncbi:MAG TPA: hypothetical protein VEX37_03915 [Thermomicrobiales bacterium]|nr:hypothetical protein [Thermomicrobiales bacterium]